MASEKTTRSWRASYGTTLPCSTDRVSTITTELESGTDLNAHVALLSLESASTMVGATELAKLVGLLRSEVERGQRTHVPALVKAMSTEVEARSTARPSRPGQAPYSSISRCDWANR